MKAPKKAKEAPHAVDAGKAEMAKAEPALSNGMVVLVRRQGQTFIGMFRKTHEAPEGTFYSEGMRGGGFTVREGSADAWMPLPDLRNSNGE